MIKSLSLFLSLFIYMPAHAQTYDYIKCDAISRVIERKEQEYREYRSNEKSSYASAERYYKREAASKYCLQLFDETDDRYVYCITSLVSGLNHYELPKGSLDPIIKAFHQDPQLVESLEVIKARSRVVYIDHVQTMREMRSDYRNAGCP